MKKVQSNFAAVLYYYYYYIIHAFIMHASSVVLLNQMFVYLNIVSRQYLDAADNASKPVTDYDDVTLLGLFVIKRFNLHGLLHKGDGGRLPPFWDKDGKNSKMDSDGCMS